MRPIDADALFKKFEVLPWWDNADRDEIALPEIDGAPTLDVMPVTYCKDCVHRTETGNCGHPRQHGLLPSAYPYDFCSYGKRKEDDKDD